MVQRSGFASSLGILPRFLRRGDLVVLPAVGLALPARSPVQIDLLQLYLKNNGAAEWI